MICKHCQRELPVEMFAINRHAKTGRFRICTDCWGCVFNCHRRNQYDGLEFEPHSYIKELDKPRTLVESFLDAERRRKELERAQRVQQAQRRGRPRRDRFDGLVPMPD